jgi:Tfp pilus assembly protein PilV
MALFHGPVRVPDEAANGKVKVTVSLTTWKARDVKSSTAEVTVSEKPADKAATKTGDKQDR